MFQTTYSQESGPAAENVSLSRSMILSGPDEPLPLTSMIRVSSPRTETKSALAIYGRGAPKPSRAARSRASRPALTLVTNAPRRPSKVRATAMARPSARLRRSLITRRPFHPSRAFASRCRLQESVEPGSKRSQRRRRQPPTGTHREELRSSIRGWLRRKPPHAGCGAWLTRLVTEPTWSSSTAQHPE